MANTLTALDPVLFAAMKTVPRELVGFIGAAQRNGKADRVALDDASQTPYVKVPIVGAKTASDYTPAMTTTAGTDHTPTTVDIAIDNSRQAPWHFTGEQERNLANGGTMMDVMRQNIEEGIRTICNEIEEDLADACKQNASRAYGTAGTTPFASSLLDCTSMGQILDENGAPSGPGARSLILSPAAKAKLLALGAYSKVNEGGTDLPLRKGAFAELLGFDLACSHKNDLHSSGAAASYDTDLAATLAVKATTIHLDTGTGAVVAGDLAIFTGDANKYVVNTGATGDGDKDIVIGAPGLKATLADGVDMTNPANYTPSIAMANGSVVLATRLPDIPDSPTIQQIPYVDPVSGLAFLFCRIVGDGMVTYRIQSCWGVKVIQPEFIGILLG